MVYHVKSKLELETKLTEAGDKLVVLGFFSTEFGPCKSIALLDHIAKGMQNKLVPLAINLDEIEELQREYDIVLKPTFVFERKGERLDNLVGSSKLKQLIKKHLYEDRQARELRLMREKCKQQHEELLHLRRLKQDHDLERDILKRKLFDAELRLEKPGPSTPHQCRDSELCMTEVNKLKDKFDRKQQDNDREMQKLKEQFRQLQERFQISQELVDNRQQPHDYTEIAKKTLVGIHEFRKTAQDISMIYEMSRKLRNGDARK